MTLSPQKISYRVKVVPAATSTVDFVVQQEFGLSGQVLDAEGVGIGSARVEVRDQDGVLIGATYSDSYGYYRYAGLVPGSYEVSVSDPEGPGVQRRKVLISDQYVFDANLTVAGVTSGLSDS